MNKGYSIIDNVITSWTKKHDLVLFTGIEGSEEPIRCIYTSNDNECCQISIGIPTDNKVAIYATDVESITDKNMNKEWHVSIPEVEEALDSALEHVKNWLNH